MARVIGGTRDDDLLEGGDGPQRLLGRRGDDTLIGGAGQDTLAGGVGDDVLVGGAPSGFGGRAGDVFDFRGGLGQDYGDDTIMGFGIEDRIDLTGRRLTADNVEIAFLYENLNTDPDLPQPLIACVGAVIHFKGGSITIEQLFLSESALGDFTFIF